MTPDTTMPSDGDRQKAFEALCAALRDERTDVAIKMRMEVKSRDAFIDAISAAIRGERERCAVVAEALDRGGREWVSSSLWANIKADTARAIRRAPSQPTVKEG